MKSTAKLYCNHRRLCHCNRRAIVPAELQEVWRSAPYRVLFYHSDKTGNQIFF